MPSLRHEIKLLIPNAAADALRPVLSGLLQKDPHSGDFGEYFIRSLYFDDLSRSAYRDKLAGVADRKKYRLRIYNFSDGIIRLECKEKHGDRIRKRGVSIPKSAALSVISGDFSPLADLSDPLADEVYALSRSRGLKPSAIVDYVREAYIHPVSEVRITFDKALHAGISGTDIFSKNTPTVPVFPDGSVILEVKYNDVFPKHLQGVIASAHGDRLALSKFTLCSDSLKAFKPTI